MKQTYLVLLLMMLLLLAACRQDELPQPTPTPVLQETAVAANETPVVADDPAATATPQPTPTIPPTPTPLPLKELTVCMAHLPQNVYLYGDQSLPAIAVRHAIYENLYTSLGYDYQAQALQKLPHPEDGDVIIQTVTVNLGDEVVDYRGDVHMLRAGITVVNSDGERVTVADQPVQMQQMAVEFTFKPLIWSDGTPVTADDSVFSFAVAADPNTTGSKHKTQVTQLYEATGPLTVRWTGLPGYLDADYMTNVWMPLPQHQLSAIPVADLHNVPETALTPLSTGPFMLVESTPDELTLAKNPNYYRANEGLPALDIVHVRVVTDTAVLLSDTLGGCDVVTQDALTFNELPALAELPVQTVTTPAPCKSTLISASTTTWRRGLKTSFALTGSRMCACARVSRNAQIGSAWLMRFSLASQP
ncbi:MAG: ABC transporter substrate-binding protein [Chloroflexota bacterium]